MNDTGILGVSGSPRRGGNSDILLATILKGAGEAGAVTEAVHLRDYRFSSCTGCEACRTDGICTGLYDGMTLLYPKISSSQALVLVSPTHTYNITAEMKAFIDRCYCYYDFEDTRPRAWSSRLAGQGRKAIIASICEQEHKEDMGVAMEALRLPVQAMGYEIVAEMTVFSLFDRGAVRNCPDVLEEAKLAGRKLGKSLASP
ncbi:MAG: flavodoxin family protein [Methanocalculus sp. MSAO_Arc1]|uniref:flavodoxin family protein n=1 Tax=Methanocalculus TaxID=71151 RepID=UPI000FF493A0|nr:MULTISPECIES: flavodoxin family protein [unclassified Methanocalculus]MCP1661531.1 multimeric flavodoxin WrbA [Methanocalculus sp. AMF5]RQD81014.1 MAG: flavodoxin family protein [Methanocalculus sp. MSAO_Arc1]